MSVRAVIFDVDGVLVDSPHERAWGETLDHLCRTSWAKEAEALGYDPGHYTSAVYQAIVAGRPRQDGAAALIAYFGFADPLGSLCDELSAHKQKMIVELIERGEFKAYPDALRLLLRAKTEGLLVGAASSSKNANTMLGKVRMDEFCESLGLSYPFVKPGTTLIELFDANECGREFERGKPDPAIFLEAAEAMRADPAKCMVIEDAPSGIHAAKAGGMIAVGIARHDDAELLRQASADRVVESLDEIPSSPLRLWD